MLKNNANINICIPIEVDDELRLEIFKNINYRRKVYNDFVEEADKFKGDDYMYDGFKPLKFKTEYFQKEEENEIYSEYCVGISEQVAKDIKTAVNRVRFENVCSDNTHKLHFKPFDKYYGSFKVHNKAYETTAGNIASKLHVINENTLIFRVRGGKGSHNNYDLKQWFIQLKEPLYDYNVKDKKHLFFIKKYKVKGENAVECWFSELDIKEVSFIHKLRKFYIQLSITASYFIDKNDIKSRQYKAGIDTGIHNPAILYNGYCFVNIHMPDDIINKIHRLEKRIKKLQYFMDKKMTINEKRVKRGELDTVYTNNYEKVRYKFRKTWNKITNIKRNWIYTTCKYIVTHFQIICVDTFKQPQNKELKPKSKSRFINYNNRFHCMSIFNRVLYSLANKYGCSYILAPENTTRTCSKCGHINQPLPLSERNLVCEKCNTVIDRDENAATNCYMYI